MLNRSFASAQGGILAVAMMVVLTAGAGCATQTGNRTSDSCSLRVTAMSAITKAAVADIEVQVLRIGADKPVAIKRTDSAGVVEFRLPMGEYTIRSRPGAIWTGGLTATVDKDKTVPLKLIEVLH